MGLDYSHRLNTMQAIRSLPNSSARLSNAGVAYLTISEIRRANLLRLIASFGSQRALADAAEISPAQISQWVKAAPNSETGKPRVVSDDSARSLEVAADKPRGWMDHDHSEAADREPLAVAPGSITLADALAVVLARLPGLDAYTAGQVLKALQAATEPAAPLERIEDDLLRWLSDRASPQREYSKQARAA